MENDFYKRINEVGKLAIKAKEEMKKRSTTKVMKNLEVCKQHSGPLTEIDIERLSGLTDEQVLAEAIYLKHTIAPNIRLKRKEGSHFVKYGREELIRQIREAVYPTGQVDHCLEELLQKNVFDEPQTVVGEPTFIVGTVGWWNGPLDEKRVGVVLDSESLQIYGACQRGYFPLDITVDISEWCLSKEINDYSYRLQRGGVFLIF